MTSSAPLAATLAGAIEKLVHASVLVVGDVMLDRYVFGTASRLSPEAPVPVLAVTRELALPGGAGNVVRNLTALGAAAALVSVVGDDQAGSDLTGLIGVQPNVEPWLLVQGSRCTTVKTRFVADGQQLLRADQETTKPIHAKLADRLLRIAGDSIRKVTVNRYNVDLAAGRMSNMETTVLTRDKGDWKVASGQKLDMPAVHALAAALDGLKIVDVRPKPPGLASGLRKEQLELTLETALSLREKGFVFTPEGRLYSAEGDMTVETNNGLVYSLRFGGVAGGETKSSAPSDNRTLFVMTHFDQAKAAAYGGDAAAGLRASHELNDRFADWYYVISGKDFQNLRLGRGVSTPPAAAAPRGAEDGQN